MTALVCESTHQIYYFLALDTQSLLCDFHRLQAWRRWLTKDRVGNQKEEILSRLRKVAGSETAQEFQERLSSLKKAKFWGNISSYMEKEWLPKKEVKLEIPFIDINCIIIVVIYSTV